MKKWGVIDTRGDQYTFWERMHLIRCLAEWSANLYIFGQLSWDDAKEPIPMDKRNVFTQISNQCLNYGIELWAWMKPGDVRYVKHRSDRQGFIDNAMRYIDLGADGFYLLMDDMHEEKNGDPFSHIRQEDAKYHACLIRELGEALGYNFKAICGEHYHGNIPGDYGYYWDPIFQELPESVLLTWTGPNIWNRTINTDDMPDVGRPLLFFDNYFASDSDEPERSPIYPYDGRDPGLADCFEVAVINPNNHYPWQFCALQTAMAFWRDPDKYDPQESFKEAIRDLGDMYMEDYVRSFIR